METELVHFLKVRHLSGRPSVSFRQGTCLYKYLESYLSNVPEVFKTFDDLSKKRI